MILNNIVEFDIFISNSIQLFSNPTIISFFTFITHLADTLTVIIISFFIFLYLYYKKDKIDSYFYLSNIIIGLILVETIKQLFGRLRPVERLIDVVNYSFPSGHTTFSTIVALSIFFIYKDIFKTNLKKTYIILLFSYPILIGISRIILNVHWFSDVICGWILGTFIVIFTHYLFFNKRV